MKARADLQVVAEALAAQARASVGDGKSLTGAEVAAPLAHGARAALEAAALVDIEPAPLIAAVEALTTKLGLADVDAVLEISGPVEAIETVTDLLEHYMREVRIGAAVQHGYVRLRDLADGLERDFSAADSETSRRIAARIHTALEEAEQAIEQARQGQEAQG